MVGYAGIQHRIDRGLGIAARKLGSPFTAYRIESACTGDFPSQWVKVGTGVNILRRRINERELESAIEYAGTLFYRIVGNMEPFLLGDVFLSADPPYVAGHSYGIGATSVLPTYQLNGLALAWHAAVRSPVGSRIDCRCQIYRPLDIADRMDDGGMVFRQGNDRSMPLMLRNGKFHFGDPSEMASWVPMGLSSTERPGKGNNFQPSVPGMTPLTRYYGYLPPLPGYYPTEGDRLITENGARYQVLNPYHQQQGVVGAQMALERLISQVG